MQSPPFGIIRINNNNPHHSGNPSKTRTRTRTRTRTTRAYPDHEPTNRVGRHGGGGEEEQENKENKLPPTPRKDANHSQEMERTLLIMLMNLTPHFQPESMMSMMMTMYSQTLFELREMRQKAVERKRQLWQLLLQRNGVQTNPIILVIAAPFFSAPCATTTPRTFPRGQPSSSRSGYHTLPRKRTLGKSSRLSTWWI